MMRPRIYAAGLAIMAAVAVSACGQQGPDLAAAGIDVNGPRMAYGKNPNQSNYEIPREFCLKVLDTIKTADRRVEVYRSGRKALVLELRLREEYWYSGQSDGIIHLTVFNPEGVNFEARVPNEYLESCSGGPYVTPTPAPTPTFVPSPTPRYTKTPMPTFTPAPTRTPSATRTPTVSL